MEVALLKKKGCNIVKVLTKDQFKRMNDWMQINARPYDRAKWNYLFNNGEKADIIREMLKYQNEDGGFGNGFESDMFSPLSAAIPTAEAIFQSYDYNLDCKSLWFKKLLSYFENSVQDIPKYWENCPKESMDYPHAPWWNYKPCIIFSPNPCAVVAGAFIRFGTENQKKIGLKTAEDCFSLLKGDDFCGNHDSLCILTLVEQLSAINSPLITEEIIMAMKRRITDNVCFNSDKWNEYYFQPLDFVNSPKSMWYSTVEDAIDDNIDYWIDNIGPDGVWDPNFSWGIDSEAAKQATKNWKGYIAVKRAKILLEFNRIEL